MTRNELKEIIKDVITESNIDLTNNFTLTNLGCKKLETKLCSIIANHVNSSGDGFVSNGVYISLPTFGFRTIKNGKRNDIDVKIVYNLKSYITYLVAKLRKSKDDDLILAASIIDSLDFTQTTNVIDDGKLITVVTNINDKARKLLSDNLYDKFCSIFNAKELEKAINDSLSKDKEFNGISFRVGAQTFYTDRLYCSFKIYLDE